MLYYSNGIRVERERSEKLKVIMIVLMRPFSDVKKLQTRPQVFLISTPPPSWHILPSYRLLVLQNLANAQMKCPGRTKTDVLKPVKWHQNEVPAFNFRVSLFYRGISWKWSTTNGEQWTQISREFRENCCMMLWRLLNGLGKRTQYFQRKTVDVDVPQAPRTQQVDLVRMLLSNNVV